jgi:tetratricopeptide (TPR) repeat protein
MKLDPGYAEPHTSMGLSHFLLNMMGARSDDAMPLIRAEANHALSLYPLDPSPHYLLGSVAAAFEYDWDKALEHFTIATDGTAPAEAHWAYASLYLQPLGKVAEAVEQMQRAVERDPLNAMWRGILASHLVHAERYEEAIEEATRAIRLDATHLVPHTTLGEAYVTLSRWPEAIDALEPAYRISPDFGLTAGWLAAALLHAGQGGRSAEIVGSLANAPRPPVGMVLYHVLCGNLDLAADWYERAIEQRDPFALVFAAGPLCRELRQTPRWPRIAAMMNLPGHASW